MGSAGWHYAYNHFKNFGGLWLPARRTNCWKMFEAYFTRKATNKFVLDAGECAI